MGESSPWDTDLDICIAEEYEGKLFMISEEFVKLGYAPLTPLFVWVPNEADSMARFFYDFSS